MAEAGATTRRSAASIDDAETAKFAAMAQAWWDPQGNFRPLHRFNPVLLAYIPNRTCARIARFPNGQHPLKSHRLPNPDIAGGLRAAPRAHTGPAQGRASGGGRGCQVWLIS